MKDLGTPAAARRGYLATLEAINDASAASVLGQANLVHDGVRAALARRMRAGSDRLVGTPTLELQQAWAPGATDMDGLVREGVLQGDLVDALHGAEAQAIPRDRVPYAHQETAWRAARAGTAPYVVTSGTGSGKTETFMVPMLDDLLRAQDEAPGPGVGALVIYPLNALITSQKRRLRSWMAPLSDRLSYGLLTGDTPEHDPKGGGDPGERASREAMRAAAPSVLVTNVTMLEYALLRPRDAGLLRGARLRWIVLDEAHSYVGTRAAEMALLLRRVRDAFGVSPEEVRLVATSATVGEGADAREAMARFAGALAGRPHEAVRVIEGAVRTPSLPPVGSDAPVAPGANWSELAVSPRVRAARDRLARGPAPFPEVARLLAPGGTDGDAEALLDAAAEARGPDGLALLPYRMHAMHRPQGGLWVCIDPDCPERDPELRDGAWPWGALHPIRRERCGCGAAVFEVSPCRRCGTPWVLASERVGATRDLVQGAARWDDYALDDDDAEEVAYAQAVRLLPGGTTAATREGRLPDRPEGDVLRLRLDRGKTPSCCTDGYRGTRSVRFGPPALMSAGLPETLDGLRREGETPRALSFADSRQGTARLAAKLHADAERALVRGTLWHAVQQEPASLSGAERAETEAQVAKLEALIAADPSMDAIVGDKLVAARAALSPAPKPVPFGAAVRLLSESEGLPHLARGWVGRGPDGQTLASDPRAMAQLLLLREVFRRPKRTNNAETMGLARLRWPALAERARLRVPRAWEAAQLGADDWEALLHVALDLQFRANLAVVLPDGGIDHQRWISPHQNVQVLFGPEDAPDGRKKPRRWPDPRRSTSSGLITLLSHLLGADPATELGREAITDVLAAAWGDLQRAGILVRAGRGWRLSFDGATFEAVPAPRLSPSTMRPHAWAPGGRCPDAPDRVAPAASWPTLPVTRPGGTRTAERETIRDWLRDDSAISDLRAAGAWHDLHDRCALHAPPPRVQEHSAQIDRPTLERFEQAFERGEIDLLACSTTMEMGVDIAEIEAVLNANVPPSPANYRQRIGRAGRRGEARALALTWGRDLPHDRDAIADPVGYLSRPIAPPRVVMQAAPVARRHVVAWLFGRWWRERSGLDLSLTAGRFFGGIGPQGDDGAPIPARLAGLDDPEDRFLARGLVEDVRGPWGADMAEDAALRALLVGTPLTDPRAAVRDAADLLDAAVARWRAEFHSYVEAEASAKGAARRHFRARTRRMVREFLIGELARRGVLPSHGFPVDVVPFERLDREARPAHDERTHGRDAPSRPLERAVSDYAPGGDTVIDGQVWRSEGVMPAWAAGQAGGEHLTLMRNCLTCGHAWSDAIHHEACPACGGVGIGGFDLLRPTGFVTATVPHGDYSQLTMGRSVDPLVSLHGAEWVAFPEPSLGEARATPEAGILVAADGPEGSGFVLCMDCGRSEPEDVSGGKMLTDPHKPLVRREGVVGADGHCGATEANRRLRRHIRLGRHGQSGAAEIALAGTEAPSAARALAAALRAALMRELGEDVAMIGVSVGRREGCGATAILYDVGLGTAGLAEQAGDLDRLPALLRGARDVLDCALCETGCPRCIMAADLQREDDGALDRQAALAAVRRACDLLVLPEEAKVFGPDTRALPTGATTALARGIADRSIRWIDVMLPSQADRIEPSAWRAFPVLKRHAGEVDLRLLLPEGTVLPPVLRAELEAVAARLEAGIAVVEHAPGGPRPLAIVERDGAVEAWAGRSDGLDADWGRADAAPLVAGPWSARPEAAPLPPPPQVANARRVTLDGSLDGPIVSFGARFWEAILREGWMPDGPLLGIDYSDRYLAAPLVMRLALDVFLSAPGRTADTEMTLRTAQAEPPQRTPAMAWHNWSNPHDRARMLAPLRGLSFHETARTDLPHARRLTLRMAAGTLLVELDQGFGCWRCVGAVPFPFAEAPDAQWRALKTPDWRVRMNGGSSAVVSRPTVPETE